MEYPKIFCLKNIGSHAFCLIFGLLCLLSLPVNSVPVNPEVTIISPSANRIHRSPPVPSLISTTATEPQSYDAAVSNIPSHQTYTSNNERLTSQKRYIQPKILHRRASLSSNKNVAVDDTENEGMIRATLHVLYQRIT
jgi:hypothetical protein